MPVDPAALAVINRYRGQTLTLRARLLRFMELTWLALPNYRTTDIDRFVATVVPAVRGAQQSMAALTDAYLAAVSTASTGTPVAPIGLDVDQLTTEAIRGVAAEEVYRRPGVTVWTALAGGSSLTAAVTAGLERALSLAGTDLQLTKTHASRTILDRHGIAGYRRVLEGSKSCGLCIVASTQRYHSGDLMPIHGSCDCSVMPIFGDDPGQVIDIDTLDGVHEAIAERFGNFDAGTRGGNGIPDYRDVLITHQHGELGPVLSVRGQHFTGPTDL